MLRSSFLFCDFCRRRSATGVPDRLRLVQKDRDVMDPPTLQRVHENQGAALVEQASGDTHAQEARLCTVRSMTVLVEWP